METFKSFTKSGYTINVPSYFSGYHILNEIGNGSTCITVLVEDEETNEKYAAKIMSKRNMIENNCYKIAEKEAEILQSISHENIIKLYEQFEIENDEEETFVVFIMEYCENGDFFTYLLNHDLDDSEKISIFYKVLLAIKYLHGNGISHGDIKLENILLDSKLNPKLCDFGFARTVIWAGKESKGGSLYYAAPELFLDGFFNTLKTDIYAIGITLFAIVYRLFPFTDGDQKSIIKQILFGKFTFKSGVSKQFISLFKRCTDISPEKRIDIDEILNDDYFHKRNEYYSKGSLENMISKGKLTITNQIIITFGIAIGMLYIHSHNIIHRDLKPSNILFDQNLIPKISDFGISIQNSENPTGMVFKESQIFGTFRYIAPEIWKNYEYSPSSDVYSFSIIVYEIFTGQNPFQKFKNETQILYNVVYKEYRPVMSDKQIPPLFQDLIKLCWNNDPNKRPTFDEIIDILMEEEELISQFKSTENKNTILALIQLFNKINLFSDDDNPNYSILNPTFNIEADIKQDICCEMPSFDFYEIINAIKNSVDFLIFPFKYLIVSLKNLSVSLLKSSVSWFKKIIVPKKNDKKDRIKELLTLGKVFYNGENGVQVNKEKAKYYYKEAADLGNTDAMNNYAWILMEENLSTSKKKEALKYFENAANNGNMTAMRNYLKFINNY